MHAVILSHEASMVHVVRCFVSQKRCRSVVCKPDNGLVIMFVDSHVTSLHTQSYTCYIMIR